MSAVEGSPPPVATPVCSVCRRPAVEAFRPFCSRRCADVDLARWLGDGYAIPGGVDGEDEDGAGTATTSAGGDGAALRDEDL